MKALREIAWPIARLGEALAALSGGAGQTVGSPPFDLAGAENGQLGRWLEATARGLGLEAEPVETPYPEVEKLLRRGGPALLRLPCEAEPRFLVLLGGGRRTVSLLTPGLARICIAREEVRAALCVDVEATAAEDVERVLAAIGVRGGRWRRARSALLCELLAARRIGGCWLLRSAGSAGLAIQAGEARLPRLLAALVGAHVAQVGLYVLSWWLLGWMTLNGRFDPGWLVAWLLLLLTLIPFRLLATSVGGMLSVRADAVVKRRLLFGTLQLEPDEIRHLGAGQFLGRVLEAEALGALALAGGFLGVMALIELILAGLVVAAGAGGWVHLALLLCTASGLGLLALRYYRRWRRWTAQRLDMTHGLVEKMTGHRTRLAQEARAHWNEGEDQALAQYLRVSLGLDRTGVLLQVLVPRCWLILGLLGLAPAFLSGGSSTAALAVGVGGILLGYQALRSLVECLDRLVAAAIAWERVQPFWQAASRPQPLGHPGFAAAPAPASPTLAPAPTEGEGGRDGNGNGPPLLDARDVVFRHRDRSQPVLRGLSLRVFRGDRLLLEGASGGGKSTLAALLAGQRAPTAGLLLLGGLDRETLGAAGWRRRVVLVPQFHDNHVFLGTFAFNALMGRGWPPGRADLEEAEQVCRALDLGPLLDRMPGGMQQVVGETGWQLSHGERSRLFIARALLQGADVLILDESFAALDPQTLSHTLAFVLERASTVLVIAHP
jgi:ATP-binding cassette subfamily B protein